MMKMSQSYIQSLDREDRVVSRLRTRTIYQKIACKIFSQEDSPTEYSTVRGYVVHTPIPLPLSIVAPISKVTF